MVLFLLLDKNRVFNFLLLDKIATTWFGIADMGRSYLHLVHCFFFLRSSVSVIANSTVSCWVTPTPFSSIYSAFNSFNGSIYATPMFTFLLDIHLCFQKQKYSKKTQKQPQKKFFLNYFRSTFAIVNEVTIFKFSPYAKCSRNCDR